MTCSLSAFAPFLAQSGATGALDSMIGGLNIGPTQLAIFTLVFAIVVILFALGTEFWMNLYGILTAPSVAFSRIMGEQQILPALFVVLMSGLGTAIFALFIMPTPEYQAKSGGEIAQAFQMLSDQYQSLGVPYASEVMHFQTDILNLSVMKALGFFLLVPLSNAIFWYAWGVGYLVAGKLIQMRNAAGVNNVVCGLAWPMLLSPFMFWAEAKASIFGASWAWGIYGILALLFVVWLMILSREFFRVGWVPTIIGILIAWVVGGIVGLIAFTVLLMFYGALKQNLPDYV